MQDGFWTFLQALIGSGLSAGIVTFALNFWKGERDLRRANLEKLYSAVHKYTQEIFLINVQVRTNTFDPYKDRPELIAQIDLINVLIDLYFPQLKTSFESFKKKSDRLITNQQGPFRNAEELKEAYLDLAKEGENFKRETAGLMRELEMSPVG